MSTSFTSQQGSEKVVEILQQGQSFGEAVMFMEKPYIVFAQALTDSLLLHVSKQAVFDELARDHNLCRKMLAGMAMRLHQLMNDVESYSLHSGKQRIIGYLLRELPEADQNGTAVAVTLPTNKGVIASRLKQEEGLAAGSDRPRMDREAVTRFVQHYERFTRALWVAMPHRADMLFRRTPDFGYSAVK